MRKKSVFGKFGDWLQYGLLAGTLLFSNPDENLNNHAEIQQKQSIEDVFIEGHVTNNFLGEDIEGAKVRLQYGDIDTTLTTDSSGKWEFFRMATSTEDPSGIPTEYNLSNNYPNPFNPSTNINFTTPESGSYDVSIYNILGQRLYERSFDLGSGEHTFRIGDMPSTGVYFFNISNGEKTFTEKMNVVDGSGGGIRVDKVGSSSRIFNSNFKSKSVSDDSVRISIEADYHNQWDTTFALGSSHDLNSVLEQIVSDSESSVLIETVDEDGIAPGVSVEFYNGDSGELIDSLGTDLEGKALVNYVVPSVKNQNGLDVSLVKNLRFVTSSSNHEDLERIVGYSNDLNMVLQLDKINWVYVAGSLEDVEKDSALAGLVKVYHSDFADSLFEKIGEFDVDSTGEFNERLEKRVSELKDYVFIQARGMEGDSANTYIRTLGYNKADVVDRLSDETGSNGFLMRVTTYDGLAENGVSKEDFYRHFAEVSTGLTLFDPSEWQERIDRAGRDWDAEDPLTWRTSIRKWVHGEDPEVSHLDFYRVVISKQHHDPEEIGNREMSQESAEELKRRLSDKEDPNYIGQWFGGRIDEEDVVIVDDYGFGARSRGEFVVYPYHLGGLSTFSHDDGYIWRGRVYTGVSVDGAIGDGGHVIASHEIGHQSGMLGHAFTLSGDLTIMRADGAGPVDPRLRFADQKASYIYNESSYPHGSKNGNVGSDSEGSKDHYLSSGYVLGRKWKDE